MSSVNHEENCLIKEIEQAKGSKRFKKRFLKVVKKFNMIDEPYILQAYETFENVTSTECQEKYDGYIELFLILVQRINKEDSLKPFFKFFASAPHNWRCKLETLADAKRADIMKMHGEASDVIEGKFSKVLDPICEKIKEAVLLYDELIVSDARINCYLECDPIKSLKKLVEVSKYLETCNIDYKTSVVQEIYKVYCAKESLLCDGHDKAIFKIFALFRESGFWNENFANSFFDCFSRHLTYFSSEYLSRIKTMGNFSYDSIPKEECEFLTSIFEEFCLIYKFCSEFYNTDRIFFPFIAREIYELSKTSAASDKASLKAFDLYLRSHVCTNESSLRKCCPGDVNILFELYRENKKDGVRIARNKKLIECFSILFDRNNELLSPDQMNVLEKLQKNHLECTDAEYSAFFDGIKSQITKIDEYFRIVEDNQLQAIKNFPHLSLELVECVGPDVEDLEGIDWFLLKEPYEYISGACEAFFYLAREQRNRDKESFDFKSFLEKTSEFFKSGSTLRDSKITALVAKFENKPITQINEADGNALISAIYTPRPSKDAKPSLDNNLQAKPTEVKVSRFEVPAPNVSGIGPTKVKKLISPTRKFEESEFEEFESEDSEDHDQTFNKEDIKTTYDVSGLEGAISISESNDSPISIMKRLGFDTDNSRVKSFCEFAKETTFWNDPERVLKYFKLYAEYYNYSHDNEFKCIGQVYDLLIEYCGEEMTFTIISQIYRNALSSYPMRADLDLSRRSSSLALMSPNKMFEELKDFIDIQRDCAVKASTIKKIVSGNSLCEKDEFLNLSEIDRLNEFGFNGQEIECIFDNKLVVYEKNSYELKKFFGECKKICKELNILTNYSYFAEMWPLYNGFIKSNDSSSYTLQSLIMIWDNLKRKNETVGLKRVLCYLFQRGDSSVFCNKIAKTCRMVQRDDDAASLGLATAKLTEMFEEQIQENQGYDREMLKSDPEKIFIDMSCNEVLDVFFFTCKQSAFFSNRPMELFFNTLENCSKTDDPRLKKFIFDLKKASDTLSLGQMSSEETVRDVQNITRKFIGSLTSSEHCILARLISIVKQIYLKIIHHMGYTDELTRCLSSSMPNINRIYGGMSNFENDRAVEPNADDLTAVGTTHPQISLKSPCTGDEVQSLKPSDCKINKFEFGSEYKSDQEVKKVSDVGKQSANLKLGDIEFCSQEKKTKFLPNSSLNR